MYDSPLPAALFDLQRGDFYLSHGATPDVRARHRYHLPKATRSCLYWQQDTHIKRKRRRDESRLKAYKHL